MRPQVTSGLIPASAYVSDASERGSVNVSDARLHYTKQTSVSAALTKLLCLQHLHDASERRRVGVIINKNLFLQH